MPNKGYGDLTGKKFGRLTALRPITTKTKSGQSQRRWVCECDCGSGRPVAIRTTLLVSNYTKSCGCLRSEVARIRMTGENNMWWKGGRRKNRKGYIEIKWGKNRGRFEHRVIYERHYGIQLQPHQTVHHRNGIRDDNRIENLELWDSSHPYGQRVTDKLRHYFEMVREYRTHPQYRESIAEQLHGLSSDNTLSRSAVCQDHRAER